MTPWHHAESSARKFGGDPQDYIHIHNWFDETKQYTGNWTHRALRHHSAGIQWAVATFGDRITTFDGKVVPVKLVAEQHVKEDCGFIPTPDTWLSPLLRHPNDWMLKVKTKKKHQLIVE